MSVSLPVIFLYVFSYLFFDLTERLFSLHLCASNSLYFYACVSVLNVFVSLLIVCEFNCGFSSESLFNFWLSVLHVYAPAKI